MSRTEMMLLGKQGLRLMREDLGVGEGNPLTAPRLSIMVCKDPSALWMLVFSARSPTPLLCGLNETIALAEPNILI